MGCKILKWVTWPRPRPFPGRFFIGRVGFAMVSQCTKFEVSRFTRFEATNGGAKCSKWGCLIVVVSGHSSLWTMPPFDRAHTTSYSTLIETMCLCLPFSRYSRLFVESRQFWPTSPHLHLAPPWGWPRSNFAEIFGVRKLGLSCRLVCVILRLAVLVEHRLVTDRRTQIQTRTQGHG